MNASKHCVAKTDARETERQQLSRRDNRVAADALLVLIEKTNCTKGDLVCALEAILTTLPPLYLRRLITVAQKRLGALE